MGQTTLTDPDIERLRGRYRELIEEVLPRLADRTDDYPVRFNHCFARITLDAVAGDEWYGVIAEKDGDRPAYEQLDRGDLVEAVGVARQLVADPELAHQLHEESLEYRSDE